MKGWLVNDCLTCIPGTKTFWHDLLEGLPGLEDKTGGFTDFSVLADSIDIQLKKSKPNYIIRNASYFRKINTSVPQISLLQDIILNNAMQIDVCNSSAITVINSPYTASLYNLECRTEIIPLGVDFDMFKPNDSNKYEADVIYIGSSQHHPKGFDKIIDLINKSKWTFNLVMKDDFYFNHPRVKVFNKIPHSLLVDVINSSRVAVCTSQVETLHLAGIECGACNVPIVAGNVGIYFGLEDGKWGLKRSDFYSGVQEALNILDKFSSREFWLSKGLEKSQSINKWKQLAQEVVK
jgi:glycosyltransferase involved in cell wall biosynthesis